MSFSPLSSSWNLGPNLHITALDRNVILYTFTYLEDKDKILEMSQWVVKGVVLNLMWWPPHLHMEEIEFHKCAFCIQVHNLPFNKMNKQNALKIGQFLGNFDQFDEGVDEHKAHLRKFTRIRAIVDTSCGLKSGCFIPRDDGSRRWVAFKYERLFEFCYECGKIDCITKACPNPRMEEESVSNTPWKYGPWIRTQAIPSNWLNHLKKAHIFWWRRQPPPKIILNKKSNKPKRYQIRHYQLQLSLEFLNLWRLVLVDHLIAYALRLKIFPTLCSRQIKLMQTHANPTPNHLKNLSPTLSWPQDPIIYEIPSPNPLPKPTQASKFISHKSYPSASDPEFLSTHNDLAKPVRRQVNPLPPSQLSHMKRKINNTPCVGKNLNYSSKRMSTSTLPNFNVIIPHSLLLTCTYRKQSNLKNQFKKPWLWRRHPILSDGGLFM